MQKDQKSIMVDLLDLQASIGKRGKDAGVKYQVGAIWERICLTKHITKQGSEVTLQAKEEMEKFKSRYLTEISEIKYEVQSTIALVKKIYQSQKRPIENLTSEVEILKRGMIGDPRLEKWPE